MAMTLSANEIRSPAWWRGLQIPAAPRRLRLVVSTAVVAGLALCVYAVAVVPALQRRAKVRPIAVQIDSLVPKSEPLYAVDPDYQPFLFYIRSRLIYVSRVDDLPLGARYILVQPEKERSVTESERWAPLHARPLFTVTDYRKRSVILFGVSDVNP
jgi:hypothetical protein